MFRCVQTLLNMESWSLKFEISNEPTPFWHYESDGLSNKLAKMNTIGENEYKVSKTISMIWVFFKSLKFPHDVWSD